MKKSMLKKTNIKFNPPSECDVGELIKCQAEIKSLDKRKNVAKNELVRMFNKLKQPVFERRNELMHAADRHWSSILQCHPYLNDGTDEDLCLDYLDSMTVQDHDVTDPSFYSFTISFRLKENPIFYDEVLWKKCEINHEGEPCMTSSTIAWKDHEPDPNAGRKRKITNNSLFLEWLSDNTSEGSYFMADFIREVIWENPTAFEEETLRAMKHILDTLVDSSSCSIDQKGRMKLNLSELRKQNIKSIETLTSEIGELTICQEDINSLAREEMAAKNDIVRKSNKQKQPMFDKRNELMPKVDRHWTSIFQLHPYITDAEEEDSCLDYLQNVNVRDKEVSDSSIYRFEMFFVFAENPWFHNHVLWKRCELNYKSELSSTSSKIDWKNQTDLSTHKKRKRATYFPFLEWISDNKSEDNDSTCLFIRDQIWQNPQFVNDSKKSEESIFDELVEETNHDEMDVDEESMRSEDSQRSEGSDGGTMGAEADYTESDTSDSSEESTSCSEDEED